MMPLLIGAIVVLAAFWAAAYCLFRYAVVYERGVGDDISEVHYALLKPYRDEALEGISWFMSQSPERISLTSFDGLRLQGYYLQHPKPCGTVVLVHGYHSSWAMDFSCVFRFYYDHGYSILTYWQRAHGESEGKYVCFGAKERYDCCQWTEYLCSRIPKEQPVFLDGVSMGASTVMMAAGLTLPTNVRGIIADCGFTSAWDQFTVMMQARHVPIHPLLDAVNCMTKRLAGFDLRACSTTSALSNSQLPVLLVHGEGDAYVSPKFSQQNRDACGGDCTLVTVPAAGHGMSYMTDRSGCQSNLLGFLSRYGSPCD